MNSSDMNINRWNSDLALYAKMKILIIDDESLNVALLEDILCANGYTRIKSILDSRVAFDTCNTFEPDLILLDLRMPHLDGFAILDSLRANRNEIYLPIIVLTADIAEETKLRALDAGATDFLLKPFDQTEVLLRIRNLLETRRLQLQLDNQRAALEDAVLARTSELREAHSQLKSAKVQFSE
jgi:putative two-component system response regulator